MADIKKIIDNIQDNAFTPKGLSIMGGGIVFLMIVFFIIGKLNPPKASIIYGLCGAFLEQQMTFPDTLEHTYVEMYRRAVRIYYQNYDAYGQKNFSYIECSFIRDPQKGLQMENVIFKTPMKNVTERYEDKERRRFTYRVKRDVIELFNRSGSIIAIESHDPNLVLPQPKAMF